MIDQVIRPSTNDQISLLKPQGTILLDGRAKDTFGTSPLTEAIIERGIRLTSSRCGNFKKALEYIVSEPMLRNLGKHFITHTTSAENMNDTICTC